MLRTRQIFSIQCIILCSLKMMLVLSNELFDETEYTDKDVDVFIDITEKLLGAEKGSLIFIKQLIDHSLPSDPEQR